MSDATRLPEASDRRRRSFSLLTALIAFVTVIASLLVTVTQAPSLVVISQHVTTGWLVLTVPTVLLPLALGIGVLALFFRNRRSRNAEAQPPRLLERGSWLVAELYLLLFPLATALLPMALHRPTPSAVLATTYNALALYSMVAVLLGSIVLSGARRWVYAFLVQAVGTMTYFSTAQDPAMAGLYTFFSAALCIAILTASQILQRLASAIDDAHSAGEKRAAEAAVLATRVREAARIDGLVHDNILSVLQLASHTSPDAPAHDGVDPVDVVRVHAGRALDTLEEIGGPVQRLELAPLTTRDMRGLLESQVRTLDPSITVLSTGTRTEPVPGRVAHTIIAAAMEALRNSLRHSGPTAADGSPVQRRVTVHSSSTGLTTTVTDDGAGFDTSTVPARRMGVRHSIQRRMESLPGGAAQVDSAVGEGTRVSLSWIDPQVRAATRSRAARRPAAHSDLLDDVSRGLTTELPGVVTRRSAPLIVASGVAIYLCLAGMAALTLPLVHPPWATPVSLALVGVSGLFAVARLLSSSTRRSRTAGWALTLVTPIITGLGVWSTRFTEGAGVEIWQIVAANIILVMLAASGRDAPAVVGTALTVLVLMYAGFTASDNHLALHGRWITLLTFVFAAHEVALWLGSQLAHAEVLRAERARRHVRENEALEILTARRERSEELDSLVRPLLTSLAGGAPLTPQLRSNAALLEAQLRNGLRARCFVGTSVATAATEAFRRGVVVELMDDGGLDHVVDSLRARVESLVTQEIELASDGQVTVRVLPPHRRTLVTIVRRAADERLERAEIDPEGTLHRTAHLSGAPR